MTMDLRNSFTVPASLAQTWQALLDVPRVTPCLPGAVLDGEVDDRTYQGRVKVKLGPAGMTYRGTVSVNEIDEVGHRISLSANGRELKGAGTANATTTATLHEAVGGGTEVLLLTTIDLTGKPGQFARGVLTEVTDELVSQFADNLRVEIAGEATSLSAPTTASVEPGEVDEPPAIGSRSLRKLGVLAAAGLAATGVGALLLRGWLGRRAHR
jgi:uncharacterized protein